MIRCFRIKFNIKIHFSLVESLTISPFIFNMLKKSIKLTKIKLVKLG